MAKTPSTKMTARRSRTGCATCRTRKLKCDEAKPICGQCAKSNRTCVASGGIAFRHEQNASLNTSVGTDDRKLKHFFGYRDLYTDEHMKNFLPTAPIAGKLQWIMIDNPYDEAQNPSNPNITASSYQQVASHSLEALSTAASDHPTYMPQNTYGDYTSQQFVGRGSGRAGYGPIIPGQSHQNTDINFLLNPSNTPANMIDPNLEVSAAAQEMAQQAEEVAERIAQPGGHHDDSEKIGDPEDVKQQPDEHVAFLLQNYAGEDRSTG